MNKITNRKKKIISMLVIMLITNIFLMYKSINNKEVKLDNVKLKEISNKNNMFAIMIKENDEYVKSKEDKFPNSKLYTFNKEKSGCIDETGKKLDILTYDSSQNKAIVEVTKTVYCYLYFDQKNFYIETNMYLIENGSEVSIDKTPTTNENYNYKVSYNCINNDVIKKFEYDYKYHEYEIISQTTNECSIYFEEMSPDVEINIYINNELKEDIPTSVSYTLNESKSKCIQGDKKIESEIIYDSENKYIEAITKESGICNIYLEG